MPSHKVLKGVARSVADQFTSLMNYVDGDYVMGHLLNAVRVSGMRRLDLDLMRGRAMPPELSRDLSWISLPDLVERCGSSMAFVKGATLTVEFDTSVERPVAIAGRGFIESPYECRVSIFDDRGKEYVAVLKGWWFAGQPPKRSGPSGKRRPQRLLKEGSS